MKSHPESQTHPEGGFGPFLSTSNETTEPIGEFYEGCFKCAAEMNAEAATFVRHRIEEDLQLTHNFAHCQTPIDVYNTHVGFCMHMMDDYVREGQKMLAMARTITMNGDLPSGKSKSSSKATNGSHK